MAFTIAFAVAYAYVWAIHAAPVLRHNAEYGFWKPTTGTIVHADRESLMYTASVQSGHQCTAFVREIVEVRQYVILYLNTHGECSFKREAPGWLMHLEGDGIDYAFMGFLTAVGSTVYAFSVVCSLNWMLAVWGIPQRYRLV
jgi:hypothetical protein